MITCRRLASCLVVIVVLGGMLAVTAPVSAALVAHWAMDEASWNGTAGEVIDSSGAGNNGQAFNGTTTAAGRLGRAGNFDGVDDYLQIPSASSLVLGNNGTVTAWVRFDDLRLPNATRRILGTPSYVDGVLLNQYGTEFGTYWTSNTGGPQVWLSNAFATNRWYHLAVVDNAGTLNVYVDGQLRATGADGARPYLQQVLWIGGPASNNIDGLIDDVGMWNNALSDGKAKAVYFLGLDPLLGYDLGLANRLFALYDAMTGSLIYEGVKWEYATGLPTDENVLKLGKPGRDANGNFLLRLAGNGTGLIGTIPEPSALAMLLGLGGLGLLGYLRRRPRS